MELNKSRFHFVGIGGIGMCGLAELLHNMGAAVTGSDLNENTNTEHLKSLGILIKQGHRIENVGDVDVVVYSSAVPKDNSEIQWARAQRIPLIPRAEALAEIMRMKRGVAIAGTHGKTTTTSMVASIFIHAQKQPTVVVGGRLDLLQSTALLGQGEWTIAEADESDGSFHKLSPEIAIITNIDMDHLDYFKSFENLQNSFYHFAQKIPFYGLLVVCGDDQKVRQLFEQFPKPILYYGSHPSNDFVIQGEKGEYTLLEQSHSKDKTKIGSFKVNIPGKHNALNAAAAIIVGIHAGIPFSVCKEGLEKYFGVDRRFQYKGEANSVLIYDDYGHHPTEIRATLQAFKEKYPDQRIVVLFQPHRYSRTQHSWQEFLTCFQECDELILTDIYPAGEAQIPSITAKNLSDNIKHPQVTYYPRPLDFSNEEKQKDFGELIKSKHLFPKDIFVTLGAGDIWKVGRALLSKKG